MSVRSGRPLNFPLCLFVVAIGLDLAATPARARTSDPLYGAESVLLGFNNFRSDFGTINSSTGAFTKISTLPSGLQWPLGDAANQSDPIQGLIFSSQVSSSGNVLTINKSTGASSWLNLPNFTGIVGFDNAKDNLIYHGNSGGIGGTTQLYAYNITSGSSSLVTTGIPNALWQAGGIGSVNSSGRVAYLYDSIASRVFVTDLDTGAQLAPISVPIGTVQLTFDERANELVGLLSGPGGDKLVTVNVETGATTVFNPIVGTVSANYVQTLSAPSSSYYFQGGNSPIDITVVSLTDGSVKGSFPAPLRLFPLPEVILGGDTDSTYGFSIDDPSASVVKEGPDTVTLTGNSSYAGGTTVADGALSISSDSNLGSGGVVDMSDGTALEFTASGTYTHPVTIAGDPTFDVAPGQTVIYSAVITDGTTPGTLIKTGTGTLVLTGANTFTGGTTVSAGTVTVAGSLAGPVTVAGGTLKGTGTVGGINAASGGTVAPGNSIGTLHVAGNVSFAAGSTYQVEVNPAGQSDLIAATGTATLSGGTVQVIAAPGVYATSTVYPILTAASVTGKFAGATAIGFVTPILSYKPGEVDLTLLSTATLAQTPNQIAVATAIQANPGLLGTAIAALPAAQVPAAFDAVSGEIHASVRSALIENGETLRNIVLARLDNAQGSGVWGRLFGNWGGIDGDSNAAHLGTNFSGLTVGADTLFGSSGVRGGVEMGYGQVQGFIGDTRNSSLGSDSFHAGVYVGYGEGPFSLNGALIGSWGTVRTVRAVGFGSFRETDRANQSSRTTQAFAEAAYGIPLENIDLASFANIGWIEASTGAFTESGGVSALSGVHAVSDETFLTLGARLSTDIALPGDGDIAPTLSVGWLHGFRGLVPARSLAFVTTGVGFTVLGVPLDEDQAVIDAGVVARPIPGASITLGYHGLFGDRVTSNGLQLSVAWEL